MANLGNLWEIMAGIKEERLPLLGHRLKLVREKVYGLTQNGLSNFKEWCENVCSDRKVIKDWEENGVPVSKVGLIASFFKIYPSWLEDETIPEDLFIDAAFMRKDNPDADIDALRLRRKRKPRTIGFSTNIIKHNQLKLDLLTGNVFWGESGYDIHILQFGFLKLLIEKPGIVYTFKEISDSLSIDGSALSSSDIWKIVRDLRKKFNKADDSDFIENSKGVGYRLGPCEKELILS